MRLSKKRSTKIARSMAVPLLSTIHKGACVVFSAAHSRVPFALSVAPDSLFLFSIPFDLRPRSAATLQPHRFTAKKVPSRASQTIKNKGKKVIRTLKNKQRDKQPPCGPDPSANSTLRKTSLTSENASTCGKNNKEWPCVFLLDGASEICGLCLPGYSNDAPRTTYYQAYVANIISADRTQQ